MIIRFTEPPQFYIPFPDKDFSELTAILTSDSIKVNPGKYIYPVKTLQIKSKKNISVFINRRIRILSKGESLLTGDAVIIKNLCRIGNSFYSADIKRDNMKKKYLFRIRGYIKNKLENRLKAAGSDNGLSLALITGSREGLSVNNAAVFRKSGCSHLLALSGMHLGIISLFFFFMIKPFFGIRTAAISVNIINLFYLLLSGITPSLLRAAILTAVLSTGKLINKKIPIYRALFLTFIINTAIKPVNINELSFIYSYTALAGIIIFYKPIYRILIRYLPPIVSAPLSCSLGAQIFTSVISAYIFKEIFPIGVVASVILTPLITLFMWSSLIPLLIPFSHLIFFADRSFKIFNNLLSDLIISTASVFSEVPGISFNSFSFVLLIIFNLSVIIIFIVPDPGLKAFKRYR